MYSAEQESKAKLEKVAEIKRVTSKMVAIKRYIYSNSDILLNLKLLNEYISQMIFYCRFLLTKLVEASELNSTLQH